MDNSTDESLPFLRFWPFKGLLLDESADLDAIDERMQPLRVMLTGPDTNPGHPFQRFMRWLKMRRWNSASQ